MDARKTALDVIEDTMEKGAFLNEALARRVDKNPDIGGRDAAFIRRLSFGVVERAIELDYIIDRVSKLGTRKMKPAIRSILRMGVYQIRYMDSVPDPAAVDESVRLAKKRGFSGLSGFVNGVLRNVALRCDEIASEYESGDGIGTMSIRYSMPEWIIERWIGEFGEEMCKKMCIAFLEEKKLGLRINLRRTDPDKAGIMLCGEWYEAEKILSIDGRETLGFAVGALGRSDSRDEGKPAGIEKLSGFEEGMFYIQDANAMRVVPLLSLKEGDRVLDLCAAPGGKALQAAERIGESGYVLACDISGDKVSLIRENIERLKAQNIEAVKRDAAVYHPEDEKAYDAVIADLPCSGLGVISKKPDIKYKTKPGDIPSLSKLQGKILDIAANYVKPHGRLVYSTCTLTREENEDNVCRFLKAHPEFECVQKNVLFPGEGDGFFAALFNRSEASAYKR